MKGCRFSLQSLFRTSSGRFLVFLLLLSPSVCDATLFFQSKTGSPVPWLRVKEPASAGMKLKLQPESASGMVGDELRFKAVMVDGKGTEKPAVDGVWKSDRPDVASVTADGLVSFKNAGSVSISVTVRGMTASGRLTVTESPIAKIEIRPTAVSLQLGESQPLDAVILDANNRERKGISVVWKTSSPSIVGVNEKGVIMGHAAGSALITVSAGEINSEPASITVKAQAKAAGRPTKAELRKKYKDADPSQMVYFSGITDEIAGTGDASSFAGEAEKAGLAEHPLALELSGLPKDRYGLIDWATAIKAGKVRPLDSLNSNEKTEPPLDLDIAIFTKSQFVDDVIFPHFVHTLWLSCANCHPSIFPENAKEANKMMTMPRIAAGEFCGRCHNRIAFPLSDCQRCHVKPKDTPPIDPDYQVQIKGKPSK